MVYLAKCTTYDPESELQESSVEILGIFSTAKLAEDAFTREEKRVDNNLYKQGKDVAPGVTNCRKYTVKHQCWCGEHEVEGYEIDAWRETRELIASYSIGRDGKIVWEYKPKKQEEK